MNFLKRIIPQYFVDKFEGNDLRQLQTMPHNLYLQVLSGTDEEAKSAIFEFVNQQKRGGVVVLEATIELLSDIRAQSRLGSDKER